MYVDLISAFPLYNLLLSASVSRSVASLFLPPQLARLSRYFDYWEFIDLYLAKKRVTLNTGVIEVTKIMILLTIVLSLLACLLIRIGCDEYSPATHACITADSWMNNPNVHNPTLASGSSISQLNAAVYIVAQALYTVGYGDIPISYSNTARVFSVVIMFIGSFCFAMVIAVMSSVIANQDILYMEFRQKMETLTEYMKFRGLTDELQKKILNHFDYLFSVQFGKLEMQVSTSAQALTERPPCSLCNAHTCATLDPR